MTKEEARKKYMGIVAKHPQIRDINWQNNPEGKIAILSSVDETGDKELFSAVFFFLICGGDFTNGELVFPSFVKSVNEEGVNGWTLGTARCIIDVLDDRKDILTAAIASASAS